MKIGIPKEIKAEETRVAITPSGVSALVAHGHEVFVEHTAGQGSSIPDDLYRAAGARIAPTASAVWEQAEMILKVKEPLPTEYAFLRPGLMVFTYLHLAAEERLTQTLLEQRVTALAYETIQLDDGSLPLLAPMSEVAGRMAIQVGAHYLENKCFGSSGRFSSFRASQLPAGTLRHRQQPTARCRDVERHADRDPAGGDGVEPERAGLHRADGGGGHGRDPDAGL